MTLLDMITADIFAWAPLRLFADTVKVDHDEDGLVHDMVPSLVFALGAQMFLCSRCRC